MPWHSLARPPRSQLPRPGPGRLPGTMFPVPPPRPRGLGICEISHDQSFCGHAGGGGHSTEAGLTGETSCLQLGRKTCLGRRHGVSTLQGGLLPGVLPSPRKLLRSPRHSDASVAITSLLPLASTTYSGYPGKAPALYVDHPPPAASVSGLISGWCDSPVRSRVAIPGTCTGVCDSRAQRGPDSLAHCPSPAAPPRRPGPGLRGPLPGRRRDHPSWGQRLQGCYSQAADLTES